MKKCICLIILNIPMICQARGYIHSERGMFISYIFWGIIGVIFIIRAFLAKSDSKK